MIGLSRLQTIPGTAILDGPDHVELRSCRTFRIRCTTGKLALDDTGALRIALRRISDAGAPSHVTARSPGEGQLVLNCDRNGGQRPWNETQKIYQRGGHLRSGETIEITLCDTSQGSPGLLMATFFEGARVFRVRAGVQATGSFVPPPDMRREFTVGAGPLHRRLTVLPMRRPPGESSCLSPKAEDLWGNPTAQGPARFTVESPLPLAGLPEVIAFAPESGALRSRRLSNAEEGPLHLRLSAQDGRAAGAGPLRIKAGPAHSRGDLHGETGGPALFRRRPQHVLPGRDLGPGERLPDQAGLPGKAEPADGRGERAGRLHHAAWL
ncbi:hypothetical protein [Poseidonocella sp. HB161398]|uniref:hypothetical protein n=1 Tax=Poseidonocella sp. HB161398 TaxID=2320855 RepID=UPI0014871DEF|nr:hypothetical protein [Poseidonocella sp. HB161398]